MTGREREEKQIQWNLENHEFIDLMGVLINKLMEIYKRSGSQEMPYIIEAAKQIQTPSNSLIKSFGIEGGSYVEDFFKTMDFVANSETIDVRNVLAAGEYIQNSEQNLAKAKALIKETRSEILSLLGYCPESHPAIFETREEFNEYKNMYRKHILK